MRALRLSKAQEIGRIMAKLHLLGKKTRAPGTRMRIAISETVSIDLPGYGPRGHLPNINHVDLWNIGGAGHNQTWCNMKYCPRGKLDQVSGCSKLCKLRENFFTRLSWLQTYREKQILYLQFENTGLYGRERWIQGANGWVCLIWEYFRGRLIRTMIEMW